VLPVGRVSEPVLVVCGSDGDDSSTDAGAAKHAVDADNLAWTDDLEGAGGHIRATERLLDVAA
jgi:hypothetical protein